MGQGKRERARGERESRSKRRTEIQGIKRKKPARIKARLYLIRSWDDVIRLDWNCERVDLWCRGAFHGESLVRLWCTCLDSSWKEVRRREGMDPVEVGVKVEVEVEEEMDAVLLIRLETLELENLDMGCVSRGKEGKREEKRERGKE